MKNYTSVTNQYKITMTGRKGMNEKEIDEYIDSIMTSIEKEEDDNNILFCSLKVEKTGSSLNNNLN